MRAAHATVILLTRIVEGLGHKLFMDNFFSWPRTFDDFDGHKINSCGTVRRNRKDMPGEWTKKIKIDNSLRKGENQRRFDLQYFARTDQKFKC
jgi:hypothetical protein